MCPLMINYALMLVTKARITYLRVGYVGLCCIHDKEICAKLYLCNQYP